MQAKTQRITSALFAAATGATNSTLDVAPSGDSTVWTQVELPDTWGSRWKKQGTAWYRIAFEWQGNTVAPAALRFDRLSTMHTLWLNDQLLHDENHSWWTANKAATVPMLITVPPSMLRKGHNELLLLTTAHTRAGLSEIYIGPAEEVKQDFAYRQLWTTTLPQLLNIMAMALALFMVGIWTRMRHERAIGIFGCLIMIGALRNYLHLVSYSPFTGWWLDWMFFLAHVATLFIVGHFALIYTRRSWPSFFSALNFSCLLLAIISGVMAHLDRMDILKTIAYPLMNLMTIPVVWMLVRHAWLRRGWGTLIIAGGMTVLSISAIHDVIYSQFLLPLTTTIWLPYALPSTMACFGVALIGRMVDALSAVGELNLELEQRVEIRTHELVLANAAKTRFLAAASHDLRQPLATAGLLVGMVKERISYPEVRLLIDKADHALAAMERLLKGLLDISRLDAGSVKPDRQPVELNTVFASIETHEGPAAHEKGLHLRIRPTSLWITSDPMMIEQILRNLVGNAIRYTHHGGVLLSARQRDKHVLIEVRDSGIGIAIDQHGMIFEEFYQIDRTGTASKRTLGFGLGLSIVKKMAQLLEAQVSLHSVPGKGSRFALLCPRASHLILSKVSGKKSIEADLKGRRILLIEDDPMFGPAFVARLHSWGARVSLVISLHDLSAWLAADPIRPDMVISDFNLPDGDGLTALQRVEERFKTDVPAIIASGDIAPDDLSRIEKSGLPVLHKPFRADEVLDVLGRLLSASVPHP